MHERAFDVYLKLVNCCRFDLEIYLIHRQKYHIIILLLFEKTRNNLFEPTCWHLRRGVLGGGVICRQLLEP